jgi:crotonobetainyl-CoA:carnitine CoA-transferase CaiB-like acyl-CoA transferase
LSDLGAEVIRIESPGVGDVSRQRAPYKNGSSLSWPIVTRSSKSATCNLSSEEGVNLLRRLLDRADVICDSLGAGGLEKIGIEAIELSSSRVVLRISGYGQDGPYRDFPADDLTASAFGGLLFLTGHRDGPPQPLAIPLAEYTCAALGAQSAISALYGRIESGRGSTIDASLYGGVLRITEWAVPAADLLGEERKREGNYPRNSAPLGVYVSSDDQFAAIVGGSDANFKRLTKAMGEPEKASDPRYDTPSKRALVADELNAEVRSWAKELSIDELEERCLANGVPFGRVYDASDIVNDRHFRERGDLVPIQDGSGDMQTQASPYPRFQGRQRAVPTSSSEVGGDNEYVWRDIVGLTDAELVAHIAEGHV